MGYFIESSGIRSFIRYLDSGIGQLYNYITIKEHFWLEPRMMILLRDILHDGAWRSLPP